MTRLLALVALAVLAGRADAAELLAITHARVWTMTAAAPQANMPIDNATVLIAEGRIISVVGGGPVPAGARTIDASGRTVTPGLVDPATEIGLGEVGAVAGGMDERVGKGPLGPAFDVAYAIDANAQTVRQARADGVARALVFPAGSGAVPFDGRAALLHLVAGPEIVEQRAVAEFATIGGAQSPEAGGSRAAAWQLLRNALDKTRAFAAAPRSYDARNRQLGTLAANALVPVLAGTMPLVIQTNRESDIRQAIALGKDYRVRIILFGAAEAWRVGPMLAAAHIPVILDPLEDLPSSYDQFGARRDNAALLARAGVTVAFSVSAQNIYRSYNAGPSLREGAGFAVANGLPYATALAAITSVPAALWRLGHGAGTLAPGADADLVIWDGDPLEPASAPSIVIVGGRPVLLVTRQTLLRDRYFPPRR